MEYICTLWSSSHMSRILSQIFNCKYVKTYVESFSPWPYLLQQKAGTTHSSTENNWKSCSIKSDQLKLICLKFSESHYQQPELKDQDTRERNSVAVLWLGLCASTARCAGSIPGQGTKITLWCTGRYQREGRLTEAAFLLLASCNSWRWERGWEVHGSITTPSSLIGLRK